MNRQDASTYQAYLLRLWRDTPQSAWRASVQSTITEELQHFATIEELWAFLMAQIEGKNNVQGVTTLAARASLETSE